VCSERGAYAFHLLERHEGTPCHQRCPSLPHPGVGMGGVRSAAWTSSLARLPPSRSMRVRTVERQEVVERQKGAGIKTGARFVRDGAGVFPPRGLPPTPIVTLACCHARPAARRSPTGGWARRSPVSWLLAMAQRCRTAPALRYRRRGDSRMGSRPVPTDRAVVRRRITDKMPEENIVTDGVSL